MLIIVIFVVVVILSSMATSAATQNAFSTRLLREKTAAYYVMMGGIELGTNAVLAPKADPVTYEEVPYILNRFRDNPSKLPLEHTFEYENGDKVDIEIKATDRKGEPLGANPAPTDIWVEVKAVGHAFNKGGKETTYAGSIRFYSTDPAITTRDITLPSD